MRLYSGKIPTVGSEIVKSLVEAGDIEVTDRAEAEMDVQAVLKEYIRLDREITEKTKDVLQKRNLPYEQFGKVKRALAGEKAFGLGEDGLEWMTTQMIESFMQSPHIAEIFVEDTVLRKRMSDILKKHMQVDEELDEEVRRRIKNLEEGTSTWEVEYGKVLDQIKRNRGLDQSAGSPDRPVAAGYPDESIGQRSRPGAGSARARDPWRSRRRRAPACRSRAPRRAGALPRSGTRASCRRAPSGRR